MTCERVDILGVPVDLVDFESALARVDEMLKLDGCGYIAAVNPEKVIRASDDPRILQTLKNAALLIPDGIGVVLAARILGIGIMGRVPGSELMPAICEKAAREGRSIFLFGASLSVNSEVARVLPIKYPNLRIAGNRDGYVTESDMPALIEEINQSGAEILFVALGSPKQEFWMADNMPRLKVKVCQGVGGTFDVIAGKVKRAPLIFREMHLEWFYRLASDPRRISRQVALPRFAWFIMQRKMMNNKWLKTILD